MQKIKLIILFLFVSLSAFNQGNSIRFDHITTKDGLPHNLVFSILQDYKGFIWFGTNNGLARYDGYNFKNFQPEPGIVNSLSYKGVSQIFSDKQNNLWLVLLNNGINRFNPATEHFDHFISNPADPNSIPWTNIHSFFCDSRGTVWIGSNSGLYRFNADKVLFEECVISSLQINSFSDKSIWDIKEDRSGKLWIGTSRGIWILDSANKTFKKLEPCTTDFYVNMDSVLVGKMMFDADQNLWVISKGTGVFHFDFKKKKWTSYLSLSSADNLPNKNVFDIFIDSLGNVFLFTDLPYNQMFVLNKFDNKFYKFSISHSDINTGYVYLSEDSDQNLWIGTLDGIYSYNHLTNTIRNIQNDPLDNGSISSNHLSALLVDKNNILWAGVYKSGVDKVDLKKKMFRYFTKSSISSSIGLPDNNIVPILKDRNNNFWVGAHDYGMVQYDSSWKKVAEYKIDFNDPSKLNINTLGAICEDKEGNIWIGSWTAQIDIINPITRKIRHLNASAKGKDYFNGRSIRQIVPDRAGNLWITTNNAGLVEYQIDKHAFVYHSLKCHHNFKLGGFYRTIYIDKENRIWAGSQSGGIELLDFKNCVFTRFQNLPDNKKSISNNAVYCIYQQNDSIFYIGTAGGLNRFNIITKSFEVYTTRNGLCNNTIYSLVPDKYGKLWISTDMGLSEFDLGSQSFTNYFESDGLLSNEFNSNSYYKASNGTLFFGSSKGMVSLNPNHIHNQSHKSVPVLTDLKIFNEIISVGDTVMGHIILEKNLSETKSITLAWYHRIFTIEFSSLHYSSTDKIKFEYKLENFDKNWVRTDFRHRSATYTNLPAGNYIFRLRSANSNNVWCDMQDEVMLQLVIKPPFWNTLWFRGIIFIGIILSIAWYFGYRTRSLRKQKELLLLKVKERTKELEDTNAALEEKQEEINLQNEELQVQKEAMQEANSALYMQQQEFIKQNRELDTHRNHLEQLVSDRTSELEIAKQKAIESDRLKSAFLANMSHEIRTPMNAIVGFSSLLDTMDLTTQEVKIYTQYIRNNSNSLMILIEEILDLSKIEANQLNIYKQQVVITDLLNEIYEACKIQAKPKGIKVILNIGAINNSFTCETDPFRVKQIITNLLNNALKFTHEGYIEFGINTDTTGFLTFFIKDTGIGISKTIGDTIFERFFKLEHYETQLYGGVGLGLAICRSLVELLGGAIWYHSDEGKGTTFYFTIPCIYSIRKNEGNILISSPVVPKLPNLTDKLILIAEDEADNFVLLSTLLTKLKANVIGVKNGLEALNYIKENDVDLILMDLKMPIMDGATATQKIKQFKPNQLIIAQTAYALKEEREKYNQAGFDGYLIKPINFNEMITLFNKLLKW